MAKETKSIKVAPSLEEATIELWQSFGWEVQSTQEIKTQDAQLFTGQDSDGTEHYKTKKGDHYIKLAFERDKSMPNYAELCDLEQQYYALASSHPPAEPSMPIEPIKGKPGCFIKGAIILIAIGLINLIVAVVVAVVSNEELIGLVGFGASALFYLILGVVIRTVSRERANSAYSKEYAEWQAEYAEWETEYADWKKKRTEWEYAKSEIIERAKALLG